MSVRLSVLLWLVVVLMGCSSESYASIVILEIFADPATSILGDSNHDGVSSSTQDEFVELFNNGNASVNISQWYLTDSVSTRHIFLANTFLQPQSYLAVFGGGTPNLPGTNWQKASFGGLSLNNTGDTVNLFDQSNQLIYSVAYGSLANQDQSIVLSSGQYVLHSGLSKSAKLFSPGEATDLIATSGSSVPEIPTFVSLMGSLVAVLGFKKRIT